MKRTWLTVGAAALSMVACSHRAPAISSDASTALQARVAQIRASASAHDAHAVATELVALRAQVANLRQRNQLSAAAAQKILDAATAVDQNLFEITTTTSTPSPARDGNGDRHGNGNGNGNGGDGGD